jgi:hypothetical protein
MKWALFLLVSTVSAQADTFERATDRPGSDYTKIVISSPERCQAACRSDAKCKAWTFFRGGFDGSVPRCHLKNGVPKKDEGECCTSGVISR